MKKIAIYTALTGGYDNLIQPQCVDNEFAYICFSNDIKEKRVGVWEIRSIPVVVRNQQRLSRFPKMHPHMLLAEFNYSLYIDANIDIRDESFYGYIRRHILDGIELAGMEHLEVDCAYEEGLRVITSRKERNWRAVLKLMRFLRRENFPFHWGMYEANCILRNNHSEKVAKQCEIWWDCFDKYAQRDQLSFSYSLWKVGLPFNYLLPKGYNTRNHPSIFAGSHGKESPKWKKILKRIFFRPTIELLKQWITLTKNRI